MPDFETRPATLMFETLRHSRAEATVAISLYQLRHCILSALNSVYRQDLEDLDLIVVDDGSTDGGERLVLDWLNAHNDRFGRCVLVQHAQNEGLAPCRNLGVAAATTDYVFILDADNELYPRCIGVCLGAAKSSHADAVYPIQEVFGEQTGLTNTALWNPQTLRTGNDIDAMALVAHAAWRRVGGYRQMPVMGWEDYDFWLKCAEANLIVVQVPEILARYRHRSTSMLRTITNRPGAIALLREDLKRHHPSVEL
jgi:glycosyltransferase involved in cell wall biosynthesis